MNNQKEKHSRTRILSLAVRLLLIITCLSLSCCKNDEQVSFALANTVADATTSNTRPNIVLIVADDLAYSDISSYGSEIPTPNIDALSLAGVNYTKFYSAPVCAPARAMLLSGIEAHRAGVGTFIGYATKNQKNHPQYAGTLRQEILTFPELLQQSGYYTAMTGKWNLGVTQQHSPQARGFDQSYVLMRGGAHHWDITPYVPYWPRALYRENDHELKTLPEDFYSSNSYTDKLIDYLNPKEIKDKPFFAYLAFTAPHWPLQAPQKTIEKYLNYYDKGFRHIAEQRFNRMQEMGLISGKAKFVIGDELDKRWSQLSDDERRVEIKKMAIYAAMIDRMDWNIGRLIEHLKSIGKLDNTVIVFMSDNGPEGHTAKDLPDAIAKWIEQEFDNSYDNLGKKGSYVFLGEEWGLAIASPFKLYKGYVSDGGTRVPAFITYGKNLAGSKNSQARKIENQLTTIMDVAPTLLDIAHIKHPASSPLETTTNTYFSLDGRSLLPTLTTGSTEKLTPPELLGWEYAGQHAVLSGDWKAIKQSQPHTQNTAQWRLFNLLQDPNEITDLSQSQPEKLQEMLEQWQQYSKRNGIILPE